MYAVLTEKSLIRLCSTSTWMPKTPLVFMYAIVFLIQQSRIIIVSLLSDLKNGVANEATVLQ